MDVGGWLVVWTAALLRSPDTVRRVHDLQAGGDGVVAAGVRTARKELLK
jgi:hypothetical protein